MGRNSSGVHLYDDKLQLSITELKEWNYLKENSKIKATISWSNTYSESSITILVNTSEMTVLFNYSSGGEPKKYKVKLTTIPSNIGKGKIYYFLCPVTNKKCRKLYLSNGVFTHRTVFNGMYECQTTSQQYRKLGKYFKYERAVDKAYEEINSKHFKTHYNGVETKRYKRLLGIIDNEPTFDIDYHMELIGKG